MSEPHPAKSRRRSASHTPLGSLYAPTWWEKRFPWLDDALIKIDPGPLGAGVRRIFRPARGLVEALCLPVAIGIERIGKAAGEVRAACDRSGVRALRALPLPRMLQEWLWLRPLRLQEGGPESAQDVWRAQYRIVVPLSAIGAVLIHLALFVLWPTMGVAPSSSVTAELEAIEIPPDVEIPSPPQEIARPAVPVLATVDIDDDITIAPTTFEFGPVREPMPPPAAPAALESGPTLTPFTVAPEILNVDEVRMLLALECPTMLRDAGIGGEIVMWFFLDETGKVIEFRTARGSGHESLDAAALRVAGTIRFSAALNRDVYVPVWIQFPIVFSVR